MLNYIYLLLLDFYCRSQWPCGVRRSSAAARLLRLWVRISPGAWMFVCCECCVFSGRGLCNKLITRPEESYWLWCVVVCDLEASWIRRLWPVAPKTNWTFITDDIKKEICCLGCLGKVDKDREGGGTRHVVRVLFRTIVNRRSLSQTQITHIGLVLCEAKGMKGCG